jgi:phenylacetate-CoA ligase
MTKHEDVVVTPSGRRISPSILTWAFKDLAGLERSQIVQVGAEELEVRVKAREGTFQAIEKVLQSRLRDLVFGEMEVRVIEALELTVSASGKSRFVVNEWGRSEALRKADHRPQAPQ